jgi:hypothetical protein
MPPSEPMTLSGPGWIFMIVSVAFVTTLTLWCFYKVLTTSDGPPPDPVQDFHSA